MSRKPHPDGSGGIWWHLVVVPGFPRFEFIESRSGKNGCLVVGRTMCRRLFCLARKLGHADPLKMFMAELAARLAASQKGGAA